MLNLLSRISLVRRFLARKYKVPYQTRIWYNYQAMLSKDEYDESNFVVIFDFRGKYIPCPKTGETVTYHIQGNDYQYRIVGFDNDRVDRDWLYPTDYINPIIQFVKKL